MILEDIFINRDDEFSQINYDFFNNYLSSDLIKLLIDIKNIYFKILNYDENKKKFLKELEELNSRKKQLKTNVMNLLKRKATLMKNVIDNFDINIVQEDDKINHELFVLDKNIKEIETKIELSTIKKSQEKGDMLQQLKNIIDNIDNPIMLVDVLYNKKEQYYKNIKNNIVSKKAINCYITYLFEMISNELDTLNQIYESSKILINSGDIDKLDSTSIVLENTINNELNKSMKDYLALITKKNLSLKMVDDVSDEYLKNKTLVNAMMHLAKNFKSLSDYPDVLESEYQTIKDMSQELINEKEEIKHDLYYLTNNNIKYKTSSLNGIINIFNLFSLNIDNVETNYFLSKKVAL